MRKMMTVLACVSALVLGAYAEATSWFNGGIENGWPNATSMSGGEWASSSKSVELSALATFAEGNLAVTATDADLQFEANDAKDASAGEVSVSSSMTFVPYDADDLPTPPEGAKGAICLAVTAGDTPVTNFYVLAKSGDANDWTLASDFTPAEAADVTIGFKVADSAAKVQYTIGEQSTDWLDIVAADATVSRAGYSGIGSVASLSATYDQAAPATVEFEAPAVANASVKVFIVGDPDEEVEAVAGKYTVQAGANVKLVYTANSGYVLSGTSTFTFEGVTSAGAITLGENAPTTEAAKAKIGDVFYISLNAAIDAATADDTVTLLDDVTLTAKTEIAKAITLDLNQKTVTLNGCDGFFFTADGAVTNGTIAVNVPAEANTFEAIEFKDANGLVKDVTVNAGNAKYGVVCCSDGNDFNEKTVACENVDVAGSGALFYAETAKMTLDADCSSVQTGANAAGAAYSDALAAGWLGQLIVNGGAYSAEGNVVGTMSSPATITLNAGTFTGKINVVPVAETYKDMGDHQIAKAEAVVLAAPEGYIWSDAKDGMQSLVESANAKAKIGDVFYISLNAAIDAATEGQTITLLADAAIADGYELEKALTLDLNGKTFTTSAATIAEGLTVVDGSDPKAGRLVVGGEITIADGATLDVSALGYGTTGLVGGQAGSLAIAEGGKAVLMGVWADVPVNYLKANSAGFIDPATGAKVTLGETTYTWNGSLFLADGAVATTSITYGGKTFEEGFTTLDAAITAASEDGTVKLLGDVTLTAAQNIAKKLTLDLNEKTVTFDGCDGFYFTADGTVKNGTVTMNAPETDNRFAAIGFEDANGLVKDVTVNAGNAKDGVVCCSDGNDFNGKTVVCENVDVTGAGRNFYAETAAMTLDENCSATQAGQYVGGAAYSDALAAGWLGQLTVNGGAYSAEGNVVGTMSSPATITLNAGTFTGKVNVVPVDPSYATMGDHQIAKAEAVVLAAPEGYKWSTAVEGVQTLVAMTYVVQVGEAKYETELEALAAVQALEAAGTYPITVANLKGETITLDAMDESVSLGKDETLTITADSWKFSGLFAGTVTLQPGKAIVAKGLALGATIGVPAGYVLDASEADADGFVTYTAVKSEVPPSGFHFYLTGNTIPGVDFTNVTVQAGFDYETLGDVAKDEITATLTVGGKVYDGEIHWNSLEQKALIDFGVIDTEAGAVTGGTIALSTGGEVIDGATGAERIVAAQELSWISEDAENHGMTGTWSEGTVWDDTGVTLNDTVFTPANPSDGSLVEIVMNVCFDGATEVPEPEEGLKAGILIVDEDEPRFAVLSNGTEWVKIEDFAVVVAEMYDIKIALDYVAKTVRYSVLADGGETLLGEFDDKDAMGENVAVIDFSGSGKLSFLEGDFWLNGVARNPDGSYATSLADADAGAELIWDATYTPSKYATLALDLTSGKNLFFPEGWKYTTSVAEGVTTYRFNDTDEAQILGETPTTYVFLDDAVAAATEGQTVQMLADVSGELVQQANEVNITLDLAGKTLTGAMTEEETPQVGTALVASGVITITNSVADAVGKVDGFLESEPNGSYQIYGGLFSENFPEDFLPAGFYKKSEKIGEVDWYTVAKCLSIKGFYFSIADAGMYNGTAKEPAVTMKATEDGEAISADVGYSVAYSANTNAGVATATVTGTGMYMDETNLTFTIAKAPLTVTPNADQQKNVGENDPTLTYTLADGEQLFGEDAFSGALARAEGETAGTYEINLGTLTAGDNYAITFVDGVMFTIVATADLIGSDGAMIDGIPSVADPTIKQVKFTALDLATGTVGLKAGTITLAKETTASTGFVLVCKASLTATETFTVPATLTPVADSTTDGIFTIGTEALETLRTDHPTQAFVVGIAAASAE